MRVEVAVECGWLNVGKLEIVGGKVGGRVEVADGK